MPQMAPYNWFLLNLLFTMIMLLFIIFLNFIPFKKKFFKKKIKLQKFLIKW